MHTHTLLTLLLAALPSAAMMWLATTRYPIIPQKKKLDDDLLLTGVDVGVLFHVRLLVEPFATVLARVRPGVRVDQEVRGQRRAPLERFPALLAIESFLTVVHSPERSTS